MAFFHHQERTEQSNSFSQKWYKMGPETLEILLHITQKYIENETLVLFLFATIL